MATKKPAPKKSAPKKVTKVTVKAEKKIPSKIDTRLKAEKKVPSKIDNRLTPGAKIERDKMLSKLDNSSDEDIKHAIEVYNNAPEWTKENIRIHYEQHGGNYINAIFNGNLKAAKEAAPEKDKKLF